MEHVFQPCFESELRLVTCGAVFDTCLATEASILAEIWDILDETVIRISDDKMDLLACLKSVFGWKQTPGKTAALSAKSKVIPDQLKLI